MTGTSLGSPVRPTHHASPVHEAPAAIRATGIVVVLTVVLAILAIASTTVSTTTIPVARMAAGASWTGDA